MTTRDDDDLVSLLHRAGLSVYLATDKSIADNLSAVMKKAATALEAKDAEIARLKRKHIAATEHNKISLQFLARSDELLTAAESRISDLERQLAEETERCARIAESFDMPLQRSGMKPQVIEVEKNIAAAIRGSRS